VAVSKRFDDDFRSEIRRVLLEFHETRHGREILDKGGVERWVGVGPSDYDDIRKMVKACEDADFMEIR
jgi:phosphonate transport system substrate-binding protein